MCLKTTMHLLLLKYFLRSNVLAKMSMEVGHFWTRLVFVARQNTQLCFSRSDYVKLVAPWLCLPQGFRNHFIYAALDFFFFLVGGICNKSGQIFSCITVFN